MMEHLWEHSSQKSNARTFMENILNNKPMMEHLWETFFTKTK